MAEALTAGFDILTAGVIFVTGNPILFGVCCLGIATAAVSVVKGLFH